MPRQGHRDQSTGTKKVVGQVAISGTGLADQSATLGRPWSHAELVMVRGQPLFLVISLFPARTLIPPTPRTLRLVGSPRQPRSVNRQPLLASCWSGYRAVCNQMKGNDHREIARCTGLPHPVIRGHPYRLCCANPTRLPHVPQGAVRMSRSPTPKM